MSRQGRCLIISMLYTLVSFIRAMAKENQEKATINFVYFGPS
jgi:hypothetical protein